MMQEVFNASIFGNTTDDYLVSLGIFVTGLAIVFVFKNYILNRLKRLAELTSTPYDNLLVSIIEKNVIPILYFAGVYISLNHLSISLKFEHGLVNTAIVVITIFIVKAITTVINFVLQSYSNHSEDPAQREKQLKAISSLANFVIWTLAIAFLLDNLGVKITAVVAGLGIGGVAVALAAQAVLGDFFSYFVIFFDKPFVIGDFIVVGEKMGVVEYVGIKTTRIRALSGEQLVFSNTDLTNSRVQNFKKMERRRVVFKLGVVYQTPYEKLISIPKIVKIIIEEQEETLFDRGHFMSYGDFSLNFEFVYYVNGADYNKYMDIQQSINLAIFKIFEKENVQFAYPSQTLFLTNPNKGMNSLTS